MKKLMIVPVMALGMLISTNANAQIEDGTKMEKTEQQIQKEYVKIEASELPEAVTTAIATDFEDATLTEAFKAEDNTYKLVLAMPTGEQGIVYADENGNWITPSK